MLWPAAAMRRLVLTAVLALLATAPARPHEIRPAVAEVSVGADRATLTIRLALEPLVAGLDLRGLADTDDAPQAAAHDRLRALPGPELERLLREAWPRLRLGFDIRTGGGPIPPELGFVEVPDVGDPALPRDSILSLTVPLPPGAAPVTVGWTAAYGPLVLRQDGTGSARVLQGGERSAELPRGSPAQPSALASFADYLHLGFLHILPRGLDHILFVLGLFFFSTRLRPLLWQVTAFTAAHTATLALATLGLVSVSPRIVEPLIAASIAWVAVENILRQRMTPWRTAVVFGFGLLHGLGFAGVLGEIGLSPAHLALGLVGFNLGVELGQLTVLLGAWLLVGLWFARKPWYRARIAVPASAAIAVVGLWWFVERLAG